MLYEVITVVSGVLERFGIGWFYHKKITVVNYLDDAYTPPPLKEGTDYYLDPNGYRVFTEAYHLNRGYCCGNGCRHCPYFPKHIKGNRTTRD